LNNRQAFMRWSRCNGSRSRVSCACLDALKIFDPLNHLWLII